MNTLIIKTFKELNIGDYFIDDILNIEYIKVCGNAADIKKENNIFSGCLSIFSDNEIVKIKGK